MCRTIVGYPISVRWTRKEKNLHSSESSQFAKGSVKQVDFNGHPMGDPSLIGTMLKRVTELILSGGQNVDPSLYEENHRKR